MTTKAQLAQYCADHFPVHAILGITPMHAIIATVIGTAIGFGIGWYIKGRGMTGVEIDLNNVKTDVETLKNKIMPATVTPVVATPVVTSTATPGVPVAIVQAS